MSALRAELPGPALIVEPHSTVVLEEGWCARRLAGGELLLEDVGRRARRSRRRSTPPVSRYSTTCSCTSRADGRGPQGDRPVGHIRERLDYSCALFDSHGALVANAPHMPVHLGSMGASVRSVIAAQQARLHPGDSWLLNSPYHGGTHLPDMTVVTPVFIGQEARPDFFVASRAHHADIGGMTPAPCRPSAAR